MLLDDAITLALEGIDSFAIDSREIKRGGAFFALKGKKVDGHLFLADVAKAGALVAVVQDVYEGPDFGLKLIRVEDVLASLHTLARERFAMRKTKVIGVTGSVGKTTTKEFIADLLSAKFRVARTQGSRNSQACFPLELLHADPEAEWIVAEMGMTEKGEIMRLVSMAPPELVVLTPITACHMTHFSGIEAIAQAKAEIFSRGEVSHAFIHNASHALTVIKEVLPDAHTLYFDEQYSYCPFIESHFCENFAAAVAICRYLGLNEEEIALAAKKLKPYDHRFQKKEHEGITYIDDSYNANPLSMRTAFANLPTPAPGCRIIAVLGSMGELGIFHEEGHLSVGKSALARVDCLLCIGSGWESTVALFHAQGVQAEYFDKYSELKKRMRQLARAGDVVFLKASKFHALWNMIDFIA